MSSAPELRVRVVERRGGRGGRVGAFRRLLDLRGLGVGRLGRRGVVLLARDLLLLDGRLRLGAHVHLALGGVVAEVDLRGRVGERREAHEAGGADEQHEVLSHRGSSRCLV